jgi:triosephosphate isomerase (TIM)
MVAGNWKMNLTHASGTALVEGFLAQVAVRKDVDVVICPAFTMLAKIRDEVKNTHIRVGAQDVFWKESGAFTSHISPEQLTEVGVSHCIVGHSETRGRFGVLEVPESTIGFFAETDETVNLKIKALLYHSITPILCVGETLEEREAGKTEEVISAQLKGAFEGIDAAELFFSVVAYEPVWAIGTGKTCAADEAERICGLIREWFNTAYGDPDLAENVRVLYGGSVKAANANELFRKPNIDGGLVGGASMITAEFINIVASAAHAVGASA